MIGSRLSNRRVTFDRKTVIYLFMITCFIDWKMCFYREYRLNWRWKYTTKIKNMVLYQDLEQVKMEFFLTCQLQFILLKLTIQFFIIVWWHIVTMAINSFRVVEWFQIFEDRSICMLIIMNSKSIQPFSLNQWVKRHDTFGGLKSV